MNKSMLPVLAVLAAATASSTLFAAVVPYTETFSSSAANWSSSSTFTPLNYFASGGPDGSGYASLNASFSINSAGDQPILFRAQSNFNSSGNNMFGDWLGGGVTTFSFSVRQNTTHPVSFFARFTAGAAPGVVGLVSPAAQSGEWTTYSILINPSTPFIYEGSPTLFNSTFTNVQRIQFGVLVDANLAGQAGPFSFDIDNVSITPAPGTAMLGLAGLALTASRRRRA